MRDEENRWLAERAGCGDAYDAIYQQRAAAGEDVHGEADFVAALGGHSVLDAGCGTGRVARELARRGLDVAGVDIDEQMLATAMRAAPAVPWLAADLASVNLQRTFDVVVMAGNVMIYLAPGSEGAVVANMARHLAPGGWLVAGFQLQAGCLNLAHYDACASAAGLQLAQRWATWDRVPWRAGGDYAVSVHRSGAID
ncbi:MAG: class I SAM-dependent methyltransferase [Chloroflexi bacterium]|nr:MAG: class I SAM-dependent methyltransferase [Chloroflexota bacterium]